MTHPQEMTHQNPMDEKFTDETWSHPCCTLSSLYIIHDSEWRLSTSRELNGEWQGTSSTEPITWRLTQQLRLVAKKASWQKPSWLMSLGLTRAFNNLVALTDECRRGGMTTHMCNWSGLGCLAKSKAESKAMQSLRITMHDKDKDWQKWRKLSNDTKRNVERRD